MTVKENISLYRPIEVTCYPFMFMQTPQPPQPTDKVVFPSYVLDELTKQNPDFQAPILFEVKSKSQKFTKRIVCGVESFSSPDFTYFPQWILDYLHLQPGDAATVLKVSIPKGKSVTFKPLQNTFYSVEDPKKTLEAILRNYMTLTLNTTITFQMNTVLDGMNIATDVSVLISEVQPFTSIYIRETELIVEFEENPEISPKYNKPQPMEEEKSEEEEDIDFKFTSVIQQPVEQQMADSSDFKPFEGEGSRLGRSRDMEQNDYTDTELCPYCNGHIKKANFKIHELRCRKMYKICPFCGKKLLINSEELQKHLDLHVQVKCIQCGKEVEKQYLKEHMNSVCPKRLIKCEYCSLMFPVNQIQQHKDYCGNTIEECDLCGAKISLKQMQHHKEYDCAFAPRNIQHEQETTESFGLETSQEGEFECPMCMNHFSNQVDLDTHMLCFHPELYD
ncbi:ubiquitin fusion degRadation protein, putative [Entamoeba dispar SAW760]|uniref:Ubiquitin fusion degRadation protein, putative n=1 Tax=Entamoeba dispar (strain ATCC PRA-260 / SAW760) TaxID=370354 RepID=B0ELY8_ENTDS|nr:ubiquitin fusion degRadation protein, putative [Entamoeba dispar SAW760]EDR24444.1 ubiquitin fusion degRadation protein, putative [Entamoeba dispar SAW760]|eukprot:EDR24444.1 ubiquitin fusion degRadation protein, putative [Entamoeba dispar SAW760]